MVFAVLMFFFGPILGNLSDRFGRQRILFFAMAAMALDYVLMALFPVFWVLLLGRMIVDCRRVLRLRLCHCGGCLNRRKQRAKLWDRFSGLGLGFILGPLIGGWAGSYSLVLPFWIAVGLTGLAAILSLTLYQETLSLEARRPFALKESQCLRCFSTHAHQRSHCPFLTSSPYLFLRRNHL